MNERVSHYKSTSRLLLELIKSGEYYPILRWGIEFQKLDIVALLEESRVDLNGRDKYHGRTLLHISSMIGDYQTVKYLLKRGVDPLARDKVDHSMPHMN